MATIQRRAEKLVEEYHGGIEMPLPAFAALMALCGVAFVGFVAGVKIGRRKFPDRLAIADLLVLGVATHEVSRVSTRDWVTAPIRAAFTEYQGSIGAGEVVPTTIAPAEADAPRSSRRSARSRPHA